MKSEILPAVIPAARGGKMALDLPYGKWSETYSVHLYRLEQCQYARRQSLLSGELTVYLAGMIARQLDPEYRKQLSSYLFEDPGDLGRKIRRHDPYIGQNAPIVFVSRINAEHRTFSIALNADHSSTMVPSNLFAIASHYSYKSGNIQLASIFNEFRFQIRNVIYLLAAYLLDPLIFSEENEKKENEFKENFIKNRLNEKDHGSEISRSSLKFLSLWRESYPWNNFS